MSGSLDGGALGRWFEELCRLKHMRLLDIAASNQMRLVRKALPEVGGVYAFWWSSPNALLRSRNMTLELTGPGGSKLSLTIDDHWLGSRAGLPIPLYVGKTAASIRKRVGLHLRLGDKKLAVHGRRKVRPTTSCQLRSGVDHFFPDAADTRSITLENVGLSYVELDGESEAANRFYLEDLAIGLMHPPFNVDVER